MKAIHFLKSGGGVACGIDSVKARAHSKLDRKWERVTCKRCLRYKPAEPAKTMLYSTVGDPKDWTPDGGSAESREGGEL